MLDQYGRNITYLRISITDRCNLRCKYCMPDEVTDVGMKNILTFEEIWEIVRAGVSRGITHVRITGGEPLVRKGCVNLIRGIREIPGVETITMTTNGVLLGNYAKQLKEAGVDGVNISLDTLDPEEFYKITGKRELQEVLAGIRAVKTAGLPVKLNAVNRKELDPIPLVRYAQEENLPIRFIEMMPVGYGKKYVGRSNEELRETLEAVCGNAECMTNREELSRMGSGPAVYYQFSDLKVNKKKLKAGEKCEISMKVKNKGTEKIQRLTVTYQGPKRQYYDVLLKYKKKSKRWTGNFIVNKGMEKGIWKIWCVTADKNYDEEYHYSCYNKN